jgi:hypothetical protein
LRKLEDFGRERGRWADAAVMDSAEDALQASMRTLNAPVDLAGGALGAGLPPPLC